jgi:tetratricopeptide (TPR) repeat protein
MTARYVNGFDGTWTPELEQAVLEQMVSFIEEEADDAVVPAGAAPLELTLDKARFTKFLEGKKSFGELVGLTPREAYAISAFGHNFMEQLRFTQAEAIFKGLIVLTPKDPYHHVSLAALYQRMHRSPEAIAEYSVALKLEPGNLDALLNRGELYLLDGKVREGVADLVAALKKSAPGDRSGRLQRARLMCSATQAAITAAREAR